MSENAPSPITLLRVGTTFAITTAIIAYVTGPVLQAIDGRTTVDGSDQTELVSPTGPFVQASEAVVDTTVVLGKVLAGVVLLILCVSLLAYLYGMVKYRKHWSALTFGRKRYSVTKPARVKHKGNRCVNCYADIGSVGKRNIARKALVLFGFDVRATNRVETFECGECADADWFEYAMRADEHVENLGHGLYELNELPDEIEDE